MKPSIVIDTNVLISALRSKKGAAYRLLSLVGTGHFDVHVSVPLVLEYEEVARRQGHRLDLVDALVALAEQHEVFFLWRAQTRDPDDAHVLELAVKARCDFIVTYNTKDFPDSALFGIRAIEPKAFLSHIGAL